MLDICDNPEVTIAAEEPYGAAGISMSDGQELREKLLKLTQLKCDPQFSVFLLSLNLEVTNIIFVLLTNSINVVVICQRPANEISYPL